MTNNVKVASLPEVLVPDLEHLLRFSHLPLDSDDKLPISLRFGVLGGRAKRALAYLSDFYFYSPEANVADDEMGDFSLTVVRQAMALMGIPLQHSQIETKYSAENLIDGLNVLTASVLEDPFSIRDKLGWSERGKIRKELANRLDARYGLFVTLMNYGMKESVAIRATESFTQKTTESFKQSSEPFLHLLNRTPGDEVLAPIARIISTVNATYGFSRRDLGVQLDIAREIIKACTIIPTGNRTPFIDQGQVAAIFAYYQVRGEICETKYERWHFAINTPLTPYHSPSKAFLELMVQDRVAAFDPSTVEF